MLLESILRCPAADSALRVVRSLQDAGYIAYFAGGCVRDALLRRHAKDFDVATNATPPIIRQIFGRGRTLAIGEAFGVISVLPNRDESGDAVEVATFRSDGEYSDGRRPDDVIFGNAEDDAARRDLTINGLFYDPIARRMIDYVGGVDDLNARRIRAIGTAARRFEEDHLRLLRCARFATILDFEIESQTADAVRSGCANIQSVAGERVGAELRRIFQSRNCAKGLWRMQTLGLAQFLFPSAMNIAEISDPNFADFAVRLTNQLHDSRELLPADAAADQQISNWRRSDLFCIQIAATLLIHRPWFVEWIRSRNPPAIGDVLVGNQALRKVAGPDFKAVVGDLAERWKLANHEKLGILAALSTVSTFLFAGELPWSEIQPKLISASSLNGLILADALATVTNAGPLRDNVRRLVDIVSSLTDEQLNPPPLITGDQLNQAGVRPGPIMGRLMSRLRQMQLDGAFVERAHLREIDPASDEANPEPDAASLIVVGSLGATLDQQRRSAERRLKEIRQEFEK
ncbi:MAG: CCA tRNA nucleotidyltransferase [Planctomycetota bacterium]